MYVVAPGTPADAKGMLKTAIRDDNPILFVENVLLYNEKGEVPEGDHLVPLGKADIKRQGSDITLITYSRMVGVTLQAAEAWPQTASTPRSWTCGPSGPLDIDTVVESVRKTNRAVFIEEGWRSYGIGAEIAAQIQELAFDDLDHPVVSASPAKKCRCHTPPTSRRQRRRRWPRSSREREQWLIEMPRYPRCRDLMRSHEDANDSLIFAATDPVFVEALSDSDAR